LTSISSLSAYLLRSNIAPAASFLSLLILNAQEKNHFSQFPRPSRFPPVLASRVCYKSASSCSANLLFRIRYYFLKAPPVFFLGHPFSLPRFSSFLTSLSPGPSFHSPSVFLPTLIFCCSRHSALHISPLSLPPRHFARPCPYFFRCEFLAESLFLSISSKKHAFYLLLRRRTPISLVSAAR